MDWLGAALAFFANRELTLKRRSGWLLKALGCSVGLAINLHVGLYGFAVMSAVAIIQSAIGYRRWGADEESVIRESFKPRRWHYFGKGN